MLTKIHTKEIVLDFINALNKEDFEKAKDYLDKNMVFDGVLGRRDGAEAYMDDMKRMKFKYKIQKVFEDEDDVCVLYDIDMSGNATVFTCGWYHLDDSRIQNLKVVFDPRPVLEKAVKK